MKFNLIDYFIKLQKIMTENTLEWAVKFFAVPQQHWFEKQQQLKQQKQVIFINYEPYTNKYQEYLHRPEFVDNYFVMRNFTKN